MKKFILALSVCAFFVGCSGTSGGPSVSEIDKGSVSSGNVTFDRIQAGVTKEIAQGKAVFSDACGSGNTSMCRNFADSMYSKGDFSSAIVAYNENCGKWLDLASCYKMGMMFEKGEGVAKNLYNAIDIYDRVCNHGYSLGCKSARRLGYKG